MQTSRLSRSDIVSIITAVVIFILGLLDKYLGLGGITLVLTLAMAGVFIYLARATRFYPYLLAIIGVAIGLSAGIFWDVNGSITKATADNGVPVPANTWILKSQVIDNSERKTEDIHQATVSLKSIQSENTYGSPLQKIAYTLNLQSLVEKINGSPLTGITSTLFVVPLNDTYENVLVYCNYTMKYDNKPYISSTQFIPLNSPTVLVWDFTSQPDIDFGSLPEDIRVQFDTAKEFIFQDENGFVSFSRRYPETWQYQVMEKNNSVNYNPETIQQIALECGVSATQGYVGGKPGDVFNFQGTFTLSDVVVYPFLGKAVK